MKRTYRIEDWTGKVLTEKRFDLYEDGWEYVYENYEEDDYQDIYVLEEEER